MSFRVFSSFPEIRGNGGMHADRLPKPVADQPAGEDVLIATWSGR